MSLSTRGPSCALARAGASNGQTRRRLAALLIFLLGITTVNPSIASANDGDADIQATANVPAAVQPDDAVATELQSERVEPRTVRLGSSVRGTAIEMQVFGQGADAILFVGGIHGDEPNGSAVAERLIATLRENPELCEGRTIAVLPRANPDGLADGTRSNANGVDLNRNFPTHDWRTAANGLSHGARPMSEPETQAVVAAVRMIKPRRLIDIHSIPAGFQCTNYDGDAGPLARTMSNLNGYPVVADIGYPTPGALGCWAGIDLKIPAITLELPRGAPQTSCWNDNSSALQAAIRSGAELLAANRSGAAEAR